MPRLANENYWKYKACFYIEARTMAEFDEKHKRMKEIAEEKEWE